MIFGTSVVQFQGLGAANANVKSMQQAMLNLVKATGDANYSPCSTPSCAPTGVVDPETVFGLIYAATKLGAKVPAAKSLVSDVFGVIEAIPLFGGIAVQILKTSAQNRPALRLAWPQIQMSTQTEIINGITRNAQKIGATLIAAAAFLAAPSSPAGNMFVAQLAPNRLPGTFPAGAVAVRDPAIGVYRILVGT